MLTLKTLETITGDPKDYYGSYSYDANNSLTINKDTCRLYLESENNSNGTWSYIYANKDVMKKLGVDNVDKAIVVYKNDLYDWFAIDGNDLLMNGSYEFEKDR